jgi:hypothetical protein
VLESSDVLRWKFDGRRAGITDGDDRQLATIDLFPPAGYALIVREPSGEVAIALQKIQTKHWWGYRTYGYRAVDAAGLEIGTLRDRSIGVNDVEVAHLRYRGVVDCEGNQIAEFSTRKGYQYQIVFTGPVSSDVRLLIATSIFLVREAERYQNIG